MNSRIGWIVFGMALAAASSTASACVLVPLYASTQASKYAMKALFKLQPQGGYVVQSTSVETGDDAAQVAITAVQLAYPYTCTIFTYVVGWSGSCQEHQTELKSQTSCPAESHK